MGEPRPDVIPSAERSHNPPSNQKHPSCSSQQHFFSTYADIPVGSSTAGLDSIDDVKATLRTGSVRHIKKLLRNNNWLYDDPIRATLWQQLLTDKNFDANLLVYAEHSSNFCADDSQHVSSTRVAGVVLWEFSLKASAKPSLLRLLSIIESTRPDFNYVPVLYPLAALFLHYMSEDTAYACLVYLLSNTGGRFLHQTDIAVTASKKTALLLVKKHLPKVYSALRKCLLRIPEEKPVSNDKARQLAVDRQLIHIVGRFKEWIFRDLPLSHAVRVVDCFLFEGQKVLYRVSLAIVQLWFRSVYNTDSSALTSPEAISRSLSLYVKNIPIPPDRLLKTGFKIRALRLATISRYQHQCELSERRKPSCEPPSSISTASSFNARAPVPSYECLLRSDLLNQQQCSTLISWLPARFQLLALTRVFYMHNDGTSFNTLFTRMEGHEPTVILISTTTNEVIGAFCSADFVARRQRQASEYFGTGETFVFSFSASSEVKYNWVGLSNSSKTTHAQELFLHADINELVIGGGQGEAIALRGDQLEFGSSTPCETFANASLTASPHFTIRDMEVFACDLVED